MKTHRPASNTLRPKHSRGLGSPEPHTGNTPTTAYALIPKATPTTPNDPNIWRVRYDTIDHDGKITLRHSGRLLHLGIGRAHSRTEIIALIHNNDATIACQTTGEILAEFTLDPTRGYQRKNG